LSQWKPPLTELAGFPNPSSAQVNILGYHHSREKKPASLRLLTVMWRSRGSASKGFTFTGNGIILTRRELLAAGM
jgi:hypothetical protein